MNIIRYKNIDELIEKKDIYLAQEIDSNELKLISKGYLPTKFNVGINDVLEFSLYDSSNNLLNQEGFGVVRYIKGDRIKDYLLVSNNPTDQVTEGGGFVVDIKRLIREAGYNTGYFRVQINFVNDRVGSDYPKDRIWAQEISPSRLEIRLLPFNNFDENNSVEQDIKKDLNQSYDSFLLGKFSGDEVYQEIYSILDSIKATDVANIMTTILTPATISKLAQEFNIVGGYDLFYSKVLDDMKKAVVNELLYRDSTIGSQNFGKPISDTVRNKISQKDYNYYTKQNIIDLLYTKFKESVEYHLPKRNLNANVQLDQKTKESLDALREVTQKLESNNVYQLPTITLETLTPSSVSTQSQPPSPTNPTPDPLPTPTPDTTPVISTTLVIDSGPTAIPQATAATVTFSTNIESTGKLIFSSTPYPAEGQEIFNSALTTNKRFLLTELIPNTIYTFIVEVKTTDNKIARSAPISFTTLQQIIREPDYIEQPQTQTTLVSSDGGGGGRTPQVSYTTYDIGTFNPDIVQGQLSDYTDNIK